MTEVYADSLEEAISVWQEVRGEGATWGEYDQFRSMGLNKMGAAGFSNVRTLDGVLEAVPLEDNSVDVAILSSGSFGWSPKKELQELERVTKAGGTILMLGPCNFGDEKILSAIREAGGYEQFDFEVPCDGRKPAFIKRR